MYETEVKENPITHKHRYTILVYLGDVHIDTHYANSHEVAKNIAKLYSDHPLKYTEVQVNVAA